MVNILIEDYYHMVYNYFCRRESTEEKILYTDVFFSDETKKKTLYIPKFNMKNEKYLHFSENITKIFEDGEKLNVLDNIIVHGSYGDYTANNYSDVDITLLLKQNVLVDRLLLQKAKKFVSQRVIPFMIEIDPFQHHGPFFLWPKLLENYKNSILPVEVYKYSWAVKPTKISFKIVKSVKDREKFDITCKNIFILGEKSLKTQDLFLIKCFLSNTMLLPALFLMAMGNPCPKSLSFKYVEKEFGTTFDSLKIASEIRAKWPKFTYYKMLSKISLSLFKNNPLGVPPVLGRVSRFFPKKICMSDIKKIYIGLKSMCTNMESRLNDEQ